MTLPRRTTPLLWLALLCAPTLLACSDDDSQGNQNQNNQQQNDGSVNDDGEVCTDACQMNERQCVAGGYQPCGDFDQDPCLEWGPTVACNIGEECVDGICQTAAFSDECLEGATICAEGGTGFKACEYRAAQDVWIWGDVTPCGGGETCSCGSCSTDCADECVTGTRQCAEDGYQTCGDFDVDGCTDWGPVVACTGNETCSSGECGTECTNECSAGSRRCSCSGLATQACGDYDADTCLEWGPVAPCAAGETCSNGVCASACTDECNQTGETQCNPSGTGYQECGDANSDGCLEWGPDISCNTGETCVGGVCDVPCDCDDQSICDVDSPGGSSDCACDPDCIGGASSCSADGVCDNWCVGSSDPDCFCNCDTNGFCEALAPGSSDTCTCDWDCEPHESACSDDSHCDTYCPAGVDPDCGVDPCRSRWMKVGRRLGEEMTLLGSYENPDQTSGTGAPWVLLSPGMSSGEAIFTVRFGADNWTCVDSIKFESWGYDDSTFGDGAEFYLYNWNSQVYELLPDSRIGNTAADYENIAISPGSYLNCYTGTFGFCQIKARLLGGGWDNSHIYNGEIYVHMTP